MEKYKVVIPQEEHGGFEFVQDHLPGFATVNMALDCFEPKIVFSWHLSILIDYEDFIGNELPSPNEQELLNGFEDRLDSLLKEKGNAMFLARVTHAGQRELVWRVHNPEAANEKLRKIIDDNDHPRPFDYRIDLDKSWGKTEWFIDNAGS